jgi:hypothetical protein
MSGAEGKSTATGIIGLAHVLSSILIGIGVGWAGYALYLHYEWIIYWAAPAILIVLGIIYLTLDRCHGHHHFKEAPNTNSAGKISVISALAAGMFFSPCLELEIYYFTAGRHGWAGILSVSCIYLFVTVAGMILLVYLGLKGLQKFNWHALEHHEYAVTGWILIIIGIITLLVGF